MSRSGRFLLVGGIVLALWGMTYGLWYAVFAEHQALDGIGASLTAGFTAAANRSQTNAEQALAQYRTAKYNYDRQVDAHSHWLGLAMVLIVLAFGFDHLRFSEKQKVWLAWALLIGSVTFPAGVLLQTLVDGSSPRALAIAGSALIIAAMAATIAGFALKPVTSSRS